jgi:hypothetical protein
LSISIVLLLINLIPCIQGYKSLATVSSTYPNPDMSYINCFRKDQEPTMSLFSSPDPICHVFFGSGSVLPNSCSPYYLFALIHVLPGSVHPKNGSVCGNRGRTDQGRILLVEFMSYLCHLSLLANSDCPFFIAPSLKCVSLSFVIL